MKRYSFTKRISKGALDSLPECLQNPCF
ncbi:hypothetical protein PSEUDO8O_31051 [Pseudomonas sp. 8O]|nr:hypothetical protein PSEUDO8O_31051 [Pseudomonas sp. 8O]